MPCDEDILEIFITPIGKPRMTQRDRWAKRPEVVRYHDYKDVLILQARKLGYEVPASLSMEFVIPMPKSWSERKKKLMDGQPHQQKPDLDNLVKAFKDALCEDDSYVHQYGDVRKIWGRDGRIILQGRERLLQ